MRALRAHMAVRKLKGSWWIDFQHGGERFRLRSPKNERSSAITYEHALRRRLAEGKAVYLSSDPRRLELKAPTLEEFAPYWFETYARPRLKPATCTSYTHRYVNHLRGHLGAMRIDAVNTVVIDGLTARLVRSGLHPKTINNVLGVLRRMLMSALEWGRIERLPLIKWLKAPPSRFDFLTPFEAERLLAVAQRSAWRMMLTAALHTGLRLGELVALRWNDVDLERGQLCVRHTAMRGVETSPKNNRIRFVPLTLELRTVLGEAAQLGEHVFVRHGSPVTHSAASHALVRLCAKANLRPIGWHALRHSFASHLVSENVPLVAVQAFLGHSDIKMTQRYSHIAPSMLKGFIEGIVTARQRARGELGQPAVNQREQLANTELLGASTRQAS